MLVRIATLLLVAGSLASTGLAADDLPTAAEITAAYRQNFQSIGPMRIVWTRTRAITDAQREKTATELAKIKSVLQQNDVPEIVGSVVFDTDTLQAKLAEPRRHVIARDEFWTDGKSWQFRYPRRTQVSADFQFPRAVLSDETLAKDFGQMMIIAWRADADRAQRATLWQGASAEGIGAAITSDESLMGLHQFPPLGTVNPSWGIRDNWQPMDRFAAYPPEKLKVLGREEFNGHKVIKVEYCEPTGQTTDAGPLGPATIERRELAWFDPAQGYLPLRMTIDTQMRYDGKVLNAEYPSRQLEIEITKVAQVGEAFYPMAGIKRTFEPKSGNVRFPDEEEFKRPSLTDFIGGATVDFSQIHAESELWKVDVVERRGDLSPEFFAVPLPHGTRCLDHTTQRTTIVR